MNRACECGTCRRCKNRAKAQRYRDRQAEAAELLPAKPHRGRARKCECGSCPLCKSRERVLRCRAKKLEALDASSVGVSDEELLSTRYTIRSTLGGQTYSFSGRR